LIHLDDALDFLEGNLELLRVVLFLDLFCKLVLVKICTAKMRSFGKSGNGFVMIKPSRHNNSNTSTCLCFLFCLSDVRVDTDFEFKLDDG
jgi:hypothetical protein